MRFPAGSALVRVMSPSSALLSRRSVDKPVENVQNSFPALLRPIIM